MHVNTQEQPACAWCGEVQASFRAPCATLPFAGLFEWRRLLEHRPTLATPGCIHALKTRGLLTTGAAASPAAAPPHRQRRCRAPQNPLHQKALAWAQRQQHKGHSAEDVIAALCDVMMDLAYEAGDEM